MKDLRRLKPVPSRGAERCFGCGADNPVGLKLRFVTDGQAVYAGLTIPPHLCGWDNLAHGGVIATVLDEIMSWSAIHLLKTMILTKTMSVDFLKPLRVGDRITARGRVVARPGPKEALVEGALFDADDRCCARSRGTLALLDAAKARRLQLMNPEAVEAFAALIARQ